MTANVCAIYNYKYNYNKHGLPVDVWSALQIDNHYHYNRTHKKCLFCLSSVSTVLVLLLALVLQLLWNPY